MVAPLVMHNIWQQSLLQPLTTSGHVQDVFNPATGTIIDQVPLASTAEVDRVVAVAREALPLRRVPPSPTVFQHRLRRLPTATI